MTLITKFGRNIDVDAAEDVVDQGGDYPWQSSTFTPTIVSGNANDHVTDGTGAKTVTVDGIDADGNVQTETINLKGTTAIALVNTYYRINRAFVATAGANQVNSGLITVNQGSAILAQISPGLGQTLQAIYTVPQQYNNARVSKIWFSGFESTNVTMQAALQTRDFGSGSWRTRLWVVVRVSGDIWVYDSPMSVPGRTDIRARILAVDAANTVVSGGFDVFLDRK